MRLTESQALAAQLIAANNAANELRKVIDGQEVLILKLQAENYNLRTTVMQTKMLAVNEENKKLKEQHTIPDGILEQDAEGWLVKEKE